ncbi:hypothetical protein EDD86DRAFT_250025 [Gorgonomyces haynaldii]|nr:hypothetical protein EDD86DRAFT_250025 [Gorgonomyces haynaldii]
MLRQFVRLAKQWPQEQGRSKRFQPMLMEKIRTEYKTTTPEQAREQLEALKYLLDGKPILKDSTMLMYLPPDEQFKLLEEEAQKVIQKKQNNPMELFRGMFKQRRVDA